MARWQINSGQSPLMPEDARGFALALENTYCLAAIEPVFELGATSVEAWKATASVGSELPAKEFATLADARSWCEQQASQSCLYDGTINGAELVA